MHNAKCPNVRHIYQLYMPDQQWCKPERGADRQHCVAFSSSVLLEQLCLTSSLFDCVFEERIIKYFERTSRAVYRKVIGNPLFYCTRVFQVHVTILNCEIQSVRFPKTVE